MRPSARQHRPQGRRPWYRQIKVELLLLAVVIYGSGVLLLHKPLLESGLREGGLGAGGDSREQDAYLDQDAEPEEEEEEGTEDHLPSDGTDEVAGQKSVRTGRLIPEKAADDVTEGDDLEEGGGMEQLPQPIMDSIPEEIRVTAMRLLPDEQSEAPPKRPFYWWWRYRQANGGFPIGKEKANGPDDIRPMKSTGVCGEEPECSGHGVCRRGQCLCAAAYMSLHCEKVRGAGGSSASLAFNGSFMLSREKLKKERGLRFHTDPMDEPPPTKPYVRVPVSREVWEAQPNKDRISPNFYDTCAVVGSSGILRLFTHGKEIDKADMVIRFNRAPTKGFEAFVGTRTSYRFSSPLHAGWREGNETLLLPMPTKLYLYLQVVLHRKHPGSKLYLLDSDFNDYAATMLPSLPTIGFLAILMAMQRCMNVKVFGFHTSTSYGIPYHYYNNEVPRRKLAYAHDLHEEFLKLKSFARRGMITLGDACAAGCEEATGIKCTTCPPGSHCTCEERYPLPVALPGFCRLRAAYSCFFPCPGGVEQCPGGLKATRCSKNVTSNPLNLQCATPEDVRIAQARLAATQAEQSVEARIPFER
eukprot:CAMPEP_0117654466 /NCGR_PEP_ID=MMETSP0804-20121206/3759_1 /TAXON_ID=1074897 /ORGANISM="Tetraselmis astigmatica, Strain CCMP880" /LENGTH=584 /DNA_ID=CAMNT_0005460749 /DNA_START=418 /DNA_END=2172 /DNA_ORIENTATION=+